MKGDFEMPDNSRIPEVFWCEEDCIGNENDAQRLLTVEIDRLEKENAELKAALAQVKVERDTYHQDCMIHERSNAMLVHMYSRK